MEDSADVFLPSVIPRFLQRVINICNELQVRLVLRIVDESVRSYRARFKKTVLPGIPLFSVFKYRSFLRYRISLGEVLYDGVSCCGNGA
jgi:hypothetical protein